MDTTKISDKQEQYPEQLFGILADGTEIYSYQLTNRNGLQMTVINYGATITSLKIPLKDGTKIDVVAGFPAAEDYSNSFGLPSPPYFGSVVGRFAGRIRNGKFKLADKEYQLNTNQGKHHLHGGNKGFSQAFWNVKQVVEGENPSIVLTYTSKENEENYPGELTVEVSYTLTDKNELITEYKAIGSEDTIVNLTQHSYFNLEGHFASIKDQDLFINSVKVLLTDDENIPTGEILDVTGTSLDFSNIAKCPHKIDHSYVVDKVNNPAATLYSDKTGIKMTVFTTQPTVHIYAGGNCFGQIKGKEGADYHSLSGICFETQNYTDAPNHSDFPSAVLKKGETYNQKTTFLFETI